jgi:hypothetical protein
VQQLLAELADVAGALAEAAGEELAQRPEPVFPLI